jgi:hypothetical protein
VKRKPKPAPKQPPPPAHLWVVMMRGEPGEPDWAMWMSSQQRAKAVKEHKRLSENREAILQCYARVKEAP